MIRKVIFSSCVLISFNAQAQIPSIEEKNNIRSQNQSAFIENKGQITDQHHNLRSDILFSGENKGLVFHLRNNGISYQLNKVNKGSFSPDDKIVLDKNSEAVADSITIYRTDINWIGINKDFTIEKGDAKEEYSNYYTSPIQNGVTHVMSYNDITYGDIYDGIDLKWYYKNGFLEYDFILEPGADFTQIKWEIVGAEKVAIDESGDLIICTPLGEIREKAPVSIQGDAVVASNWTINGNVVGLEVQKYDRSKKLIIDPTVYVLHLGTYFGGPANDISHSCVLDAASNVYLSGYTLSYTSIATIGSHQTVLANSSDAFLAKFDNNGVLQWATYYGGFNNDYGESCAVDDSLNVYMAGYTYSPTAISTLGSHQDTFAGTLNAFLVKFNSNGVRQWATYYGGLGGTLGKSCTVDASSNVYLAGETVSPTSISTSGSHQSVNGGIYDAFLVKFNSNGVRQWATYYGGSNPDYGWACASDALSNVYLAGITESFNSISTVGSHQTANGGGLRDAFLVKFDSNGVRQWGTYYGGSGDDRVYHCAPDGSSGVYLSGFTSSASSIASSGSHQSSIGGNNDAFLVKFDAGGVRQWATYYGGTGNEYGYACMVDNASNVYMCGETSSASSMATSGTYQPSYGGGPNDGYLVQFNASGIRQWGTYYGGTNQDEAYSCQMDASSNVYLCGLTKSFNNIATIGSHQPTKSAGSDAFLVKLGECIANYDTLNMTVCDSLIAPSGSYTWTVSGTYTDSLINAVGCDSILTIHLTVNATPIITSTTNDSVCDMGSVPLSATTNSGSLEWFSAPTGGISLGTGSAYITPTIISTTTYYAEAKDNSCISPRSAVVAKVNSTPTILSTTDDSICDMGSATLSATSISGSLAWFSTPTGGISLGTGNTYLTSTIMSTTTYYAEANYHGCISPRSAVVAKVNVTPAIISTTPGSLCDSGMISLNAVESAGMLSWYDSPTGGLFLGTGSSFMTPNIFSTKTYYAEAEQSGCKSVRSAINAVVLKSSMSILNDTACYVYSSPSGLYSYSESGTYFDTIPNTAGCDSLITINLIINRADTSVSLNNNALTANAVQASYQWIDCSDGSKVIGATAKVYIPSLNGEYAVVVVQNGCTDTSKCYSVNSVGIHNRQINDIRLYPNPSNGRVFVELDKEYKEITIELIDLNGKVVDILKYINRSQFILTLPEQTGLYTLRIKTDEGINSYHVIKE